MKRQRFSERLEGLDAPADEHQGGKGLPSSAKPWGTTGKRHTEKRHPKVPPLSQPAAVTCAPPPTT